MNIYTFDVICESQDFGHEEEFVSREDFDTEVIYRQDQIKLLQKQNEQKDKVIEILKSTCEFYRDYENDIKDQGYDLDCRAGGALKQIEDLTQKEN